MNMRHAACPGSGLSAGDTYLVIHIISRGNLASAACREELRVVQDTNRSAQWISYRADVGELHRSVERYFWMAMSLSHSWFYRQKHCRFSITQSTRYTVKLQNSLPRMGSTGYLGRCKCIGSLYDEFYGPVVIYRHLNMSNRSDKTA